jgi:hypothetical protein
MTPYVIPAAWRAPMPEDALSRLIAGVRARVEAYPTEAALERRRECEGCDTGEFEVYP